MATGVWTLYDSVPFRVGSGDIDFANDTFKIAFLTSSYTPSAAHDTYSDLTNELTTTGGYTSGGFTVTLTTASDLQVGISAGSAPDITATADLIFRYMVLYDSTTNYLVAYCLADSTPANYTITSGNVWNLADTVFLTVLDGGTNDWKHYGENTSVWWEGLYDLGAATAFKMALFTDAYVPDTGTSGDTTYTGISANELASGNGYTTGGVVIGQTWTDLGSGLAELDLSSPATWTFTADKSYRYAVIYRTTGNVLLCVADLTGGGNDTCNNNLTINASVSGVLRATK